MFMLISKLSFKKTPHFIELLLTLASLKRADHLSFILPMEGAEFTFCSRLRKAQHLMMDENHVSPFRVFLNHFFNHLQPLDLWFVLSSSVEESLIGEGFYVPSAGSAGAEPSGSGPDVISQLTAPSFNPTWLSLILHFFLFQNQFL